MEVKVVGKSDLKSGTFEGKDWAHRKLYVIHKSAGVTGMECETYKIKPEISDLAEVMPNDNVEVVFDSRGRVQDIKRVQK